MERQNTNIVLGTCLCPIVSTPFLVQKGNVGSVAVLRQPAAVISIGIVTAMNAFGWNLRADVRILIFVSTQKHIRNVKAILGAVGNSDVVGIHLCVDFSVPSQVFQT